MKSREFITSLILLAKTSTAWAIPAPGPAHRFSLARAGMERYLQVCLQTSNPCGLTPTESELTLKILKALPQELAIEGQYPANDPGLFDSDPASPHRIARTGDTVGSAVTLNLDQVDRVDYFEALGLMVHEYGHHHGVKDTVDRPLDVLGAKIAKAIRAQSEVVRFAEYGDIQVIAHNLPSDFTPVAGVPLSPDAEKDTTQLILINPNEGNRWSIDLSRDLVCPLSAPARAGWRLRNLRAEPALEWDPVRLEQGLRFRGELTIACRAKPSDPVTHVIQATFGADMLILPDDMANGGIEPGWWKARPARVDLSRTFVTYVQEGMAEFRDFFSWSRVDDGEHLRVGEVSSAASESERGTAWRLEAEVASDLTPVSCSGRISSDQFLARVGKPRYSFDFSRCAIEALGSGRFRVKLEQEFQKGTQGRTYYLDAIAIRTADEAVVAYPTFRTEFKLADSAPERTLKFVRGAVVRKRGNEPVETLKSPLDLRQSPQEFALAPEDLVKGIFQFEGTARVADASYVSIRLDWLPSGKTGHEGKRANSRFIPKIRPFSSNEPWGLPVNGSSTISTLADSETQEVGITLRPYSNSGGEIANRVFRADFQHIWLIDEYLREIFLQLDLGFVIKWPTFQTPKPR